MAAAVAGADGLLHIIPGSPQLLPRVPSPAFAAGLQQGTHLTHRRLSGTLFAVGIQQERTVTENRSDVLQGTLELLILKVLSQAPMHGWGIAQRIQHVSRDTFQVNHGSLYPALQKMTGKGWITAEWRTTENNRRARYYTLTPAGSRQLEKERAAWDRSTTAVNWILDWTGETA